MSAPRRYPPVVFVCHDVYGNAVDCWHTREAAVNTGSRDIREYVAAPGPALTDRQRTALADLLTRIGSWTSARWDQHLRYEVGDEDADAIIAWLAAHGIEPYRPQNKDPSHA